MTLTDKSMSTRPLGRKQVERTALTWAPDVRGGYCFLLLLKGL
jgi:hypothetical protein